MQEAVKPKPLSEPVKKGLAYLVSQQQKNGGWGQGGGWRVAADGGRAEGEDVKDPPDLGNTCIATLALFDQFRDDRIRPTAATLDRKVEAMFVLREAATGIAGAGYRGSCAPSNRQRPAQ